jgi:hypothetical protein
MNALVTPALAYVPGKIVWIGMPHTVSTDAFHQLPVRSEMSRPLTHVVVAGIVKDARTPSTFRLVMDVDDHRLPQCHPVDSVGS